RLAVRFDPRAEILSAETDDSPGKPLRFESRPRTPQKTVRKKSEDPTLRKIIAVHEAGHAVVGIALLGMMPKRIYCATVKPAYGGHVEFAEISVLSRPMAFARVACMLGGIAAEEWVFGRNELSNGSSEDLRMATRLVSDV